ncbi:MAG TPA: CocE/NonD family hydrolase [Candidatus Didemnitutus sp.]|nr:CocE/NonD family hydrolase [Candidatus Didemnitutus sp.]
MMPRAFLRLLPIFAGAVLTLSAAADSAAADPYDSVKTTEAMVPMRDGVHLATDIHQPARAGIAVDGRWPVILIRTPYDKRVRVQGLGEIFVRHGYVLVAQDVRGRYRSEGLWRPLRDDPLDGFDTAAWILQQPWANGKIGTIGTSYEGGTQHALAIAGAPGVVAMIPRNAMSDFGLYGVRHHGAFELRWLNWVMTMGNASGTPDALPAARRAAADPAAAPALVELGLHVRDYVQALPLRAGTTPLQWAPDYEAWLIEAMRHGAYDQFWKDAGSSVVDHLSEYKDIPVYHVTGWYDSWGTPAANLNYVNLKKAKHSLQRLMVGPWIHSRENLDHAGIAQFTPDAALDAASFHLRWFDHWLKGVDNGVEREPPVRLYVMGGGDGHRTPEGRVFVGGHWRDEQEWPLARTAYTSYFLHAGGNLTPQAPGDERSTSYAFDPRHPVPTLGGNISSQGNLMDQGAADQRDRTDFWLTHDTLPLSARSDVVVFRTDPLAEPVEVTGRLVVRLWASSSARDTDFTAKLVDVYPPSADFPGGIDLNIGDGIVRARYRNNLDHEELLEPGRPYEFEIEMYPTSLVFGRGHRIRLDVSSSNFPRFDVNPNTGEPMNDNRRQQIAVNTLLTDAAHPSRLILPVIPR